MKYRLKEFLPGRWHVMFGDMPIYDDKTNGDDAPLVFTDPDIAQECADKLNKEVSNE